MFDKFNTKSCTRQDFWQKLRPRLKEWPNVSQRLWWFLPSLGETLRNDTDESVTKIMLFVQQFKNHFTILLIIYLAML